MAETSSSEAIRANLKAFRELRGLSQAKLGRLAGIGPASVSHFETGQRVPTVESVVRLADALRVSVDALLGRVSIEASAHVDPLFIRASKADSQTLETLRRVTEALLQRPESSKK